MSGSEIEPHRFKMPSRTTLNEQQRMTWLDDLANPAVPFSRLARTIPHLPKGEKLLDMLITRSVPDERALWLIRLLGAYEIVRR